jgi:hypothetical protein
MFGLFMHLAVSRKQWDKRRVKDHRIGGMIGDAGQFVDTIPTM